MRIVVFGTSTFAVPALRALAPHVTLVVSQPDRPSGRGHRLQPSPMKAAALELGIPVETPERSRAPEFVERLRSEGADFLLVAAYGQIVSQAVLDSARHGGINLHGSILPKYRGAAPIQRAIEAGETETGVTLMQMDRGMDTGDMIAVEPTPIGPDETYGELHERLAGIAGRMALAWAPRLASGDYPRTPQDGNLATHAPKVERAETEVRWDSDAEAEYRRFRAFTPSPGVSLATSLGRLRLSQVRLGTREGRPGTVLAIDDALEIALGRGSLRLLEVQPEGKKRQSGRDFANGTRLPLGSYLAEAPADAAPQP